MADAAHPLFVAYGLLTTIHQLTRLLPSLSSIEVMPMPDFRRQDRSVSLHASESLVRRTALTKLVDWATEKDWTLIDRQRADDRSGQVETLRYQVPYGRPSERYRLGRVVTLSFKIDVPVSRAKNTPFFSL